MTDRSVSISLRARVSDFIAGMGRSSSATQDLSRNMTETGASADRMRKRLEAATRALPKIEIDADSSQAEIKFAELRRQLESLSGKRIGIDIDSTSARAELAQIERELEKLQRSDANIDVRADIGTALAELRAVDSEASKVDGRRAEVKVDADVAGALRGIALVGAALASLPAVTTIGVGVAGLGAAFAAAGAGAGAFAAVAIPGLKRVNEALNETKSAAGGAGSAMKGAAQKAADAAAAALRLAEAQDRVKDSADKVKDAQRKVQDALHGVTQAKAAAAQAADDAAYREVQAASRIADAERSVQDAHRATQRAIEDLTRARERAQERIENLALATEGGALSEERARLSIERAKQELARVNASNASPLDKQDAALRLREAEFALKEIRERNGDLAKERAESDKKGVEGSDEVVAAKERILDAQRAEADAERAVGEARTQAARDAVAGQKQVADANIRVADAQRKVADAQRDVIKAQRDAERAAQRLKLEQLQAKAALEATGNAAGGGGGAASKMAALSKAERELADDLKHFKDVYLDWQRSLQPEVFPVISKGLGLMESSLPRLTPLVKSASSAFSILEDDLTKALAGPFWDTFLYNVNTQVPGAIVGLGRSFGDITTGLAGILDAFLPFTPTIVGGIEKASKAFSDWGQGLKDSAGFHEFIDFVKREAPEVWDLIKNVAKAIGNIGEAVAPLGVAAFGGLGLLAKLVAGMDPGHIQGIALAIGAIKLATLGMSAAKAWEGLAGGIGATGTAAGKASGKVAAFSKAAIGISAAVIGLEATGSAINALEGQSQGIDKLTLALTELGQTGKFAGDLEVQWGGALGDAQGAIEKFQHDLSSLKDPGWFETIFEHPATELGALLPGIDSSVDRIEQRFSDLDTGLAAMVTNGNADQAAKAFDFFAKKAAESGIPVEKLKELLPTYSQAVRVAGNASATAAVGVDLAKQKMDGFNKSVGTFAGRTDALQAMQNLKTAFNEAEKAIHDANGKLEVSAGMTDKQRDAVITAREKFAGYIDAVKTAADGAQTLTDRTTDGTRAVLEQLPKLAGLAGGNKEARDQILLLAEAYGISKTDAEKAMGSAKGLRDMLAQLKSKELEITANTEKAKASLRALLDQFIKPYDIPIGIRKLDTPVKRERGGIERYASGGVRSTAPNIAAQPTILYGEGRGPEAFIPFDPAFRGNAIELLGQVADKFGLQVFNKGASQSLSDLSVTIDGSGMQVATGLESVMGSLQATMGAAGSLTSSIAKVGSSAAQLDQAWLAGSQVLSGSVASLGTGVADSSATVVASVDGLTSSVQLLGEAVSVAVKAASDAPGMVAGSGPKKAASKSKAGLSAVETRGKIKPPGGFVEGNQPLSGYASGGIVTKPTIAMIGEAGREAIVPLDDPRRGRVMLGHAARMLGGPVNSSRVSAPQQVSRAYAGAPSGGSSPGSSSGGSGGSSRGDGVNVYGLVVRSEADIAKVSAQIAMRRGGRG